MDSTSSKAFAARPALYSLGFVVASLSRGKTRAVEGESSSQGLDRIPADVVLLSSIPSSNSGRTS